MKIIIAGAGEVGTHLAKLLSREEQDIILIDSDEKKLRVFDSKLNIMTNVGNPTRIEVLKEAGVRGCDLFIAVTPHESLNITACILAANLGAQKTVARIENQEYLIPKNREFFSNIGVHELIYPEMLATEEILASLKQTWVRQQYDFGKGALRMLGIKVRANAMMLETPLFELTNINSHFHLVAIKRNSETIIPRGSDVVKAGDIVYFMLRPEHENDVKQVCGKRELDVRKIMIAGAGKITILTTNNAPDKMNIKIIEPDPEKAQKIVEKVDKAMIIQGDPRNTELLKEEGIKNIDAYIALSDSSEENILSCLTAKNFGIKKTVAEVENIDYIQMAESLDIGTIINKKLIAASQIYRMLLESKAVNVKCLTFADAEVIEMIAKENSKVTKKTVKELNLPKGITLGGLVRNGKGMLINGDTQIEPNDTVIVFFLGTAIHKMDKYFN
ncbi:MAG: Trk system potassium transporter TrkA [Bacteroidales bacterium]